MIRVHARPLSPQQIVSLSPSSYVSPVQLTVVRGGGGRGDRRGAESYDPQKAWPSINHSILFGWYRYKVPDHKIPNNKVPNNKVPNSLNS
jgi:hypothetical protein